MNKNITARLMSLLTRRELKENLAKVARVLSCIAVFCITYILVAPVLTEEWPAVCGLEEHTHDDSCYEERLVQPEPELICGMEETGHVHTDACYEMHQGDLMCTETGTEEEPHEHNDSCYAWSYELICGLEEGGHVHDESCYAAPAEPYTERVLICELPEHTHTDSCYHVPEENPAPEYICGFSTEHTHTEECYFEDGSLKCTIPEHTHTEDCVAVELPELGENEELMPVDEQFTYENEEVTVTFTVQGEIPVARPAEDRTVEDNTAETDSVEAETEATEPAEVDSVETGEPAVAETAEPVLELVVTESEDTEVCNEYEELATEDGDVMLMQVLDYSLMLDGTPVDLSRCEVTTQVTPKPELQQMMDSPMPLMTYAAEDTEDETGEPEMVMELATYSESNGEMAYAVVAMEDPSFTVQYYAYLERAVMTDYEVGGGKTLPETYNNEFPAKNMVAIINTSAGSTAETAKAIGGRLPKNGNIDTVDRWKSPNDNKIGVLTIKDGKIKTDEQLTEIYKSEQLTYKKAPGLMYFNIVNQNSDSQYTLKQIWVLKEEYKYNEAIANSADETYTKDETYWEKIDYTSSIRFTNRPQTAAANPDYILIDENAVVRLVYDTKNTTKDFDANFYDYDISDGFIYSSKWSGQEETSKQTDTKTWYTKTSAYGINAAATTGSGARLAFGNGDHSDYGKISWNGKYTLNKANLKGFMICTYGLVQRLDGTYVENEETGKLEYHGNLVYSNGVAAPNLFNEGGANGKTSYDKKEYSLKFDRVGDTYTLKAVNGASTAQNLDQLNHPSYTVNNKTTTHKHIWTNNFWPMDSAPIWGADNHDMKFGSAESQDKRKNQVGNLPTSDDGQDHNSYFGMQYAVTFDLSSSYVGPLEYFFFGDDDMWVFLNDKLVCDIGGVHTSVGQYVNLWDYIDRSELLEDDGKTPIKVDKVERDAKGKVIKDADGNPIIVYEKDKDGNYKLDENGNKIPEKEDMVKTYTLNFYYTERGASGSTCWMQFTLPTVVGVNLDSVLDEQLGENTGSVSIQKKVDGIETNEWFEFTISGLNDNYKPLLYNANGELITDEELIEKSGYIVGGNNSLFKIRPEDTLVLRNIPADTVLNIVEKGEYDETGSSMDGYQSFVTIDGVEQNTAPEANVTITAGQRVKVVYTNVSSYELPATGGSGTVLWYTMGGMMALTALCLLVYNNNKQKRGRATN